jgi:hypothetical protein
MTPSPDARSTPKASLQGPSPTGAVVYIADDHAAIVTIASDGRIRTSEIDRGWWPEARFVSKIVRIVGDRDRVAILGVTDARLALEREYTAEFRRPDHLIDVEGPGDGTLDELVSRLKVLAG